ncbi:hypothetical protein [Klebsiella pneumoniae]|uniref:hypothetical protein n=1 Tax=Klebsiella pneumoniae TaxID=573 RepID=UPI0013C36544|nr:hypothetical protein [Klebsiella pneumoniae]
MCQFFQKTAKVEMAGSGSEHEFPRCDGHGGADFADTKDVKKPTGEAGFFTVYATKLMTLTRKELSITDAKNDNLFYLINATCHKFTGKADHLILLPNTKVVKIAVGSLRL